MVHLTVPSSWGGGAKPSVWGCGSRLPADSAGEPGGKDELPGCIAVLGECLFGFGLWKLPARGITLGPDLVQEITAAHGVEDQLGLGRRVGGRTRLRQ